MITYHSPMTGLEARMEKEIAGQAHKTNKTLAQTQQAHTRRDRKRSRETEKDREIGEAMVLAR